MNPQSWDSSQAHHSDGLLHQHGGLIHAQRGAEKVGQANQLRLIQRQHLGGVVVTQPGLISLLLRLSTHGFQRPVHLQSVQTIFQ